MTQADLYAFWRGALEENYPYPMQEGKFECGFWRTRNRDKTWSAVAIWKENDEWRILVNSKLVEPESFVSRWNYTWTNPVTKEAYDAFRETGKWPGEIDVPAIGDNQPPDEYATLKDDIEDSVAQALKWLEAHKDIQSQEDADTAANWRERLNKLGNRAEEQRKAEKKPLADQVKKIDSKYRAIVKAAKGAADTLRGALTAFMHRKEEAERKRLAEERRKAEEERARLEAERKALADQDIALAAMEPELSPVPEPEPVKIQAGGQFGRATGFRTVKAAEIEDIDKVFAYFKDNEKVLDVLQKLTNQVVKSGGSVPGAKLVETRVAA